MTRVDVLPELKQIVGALLFAARKPLTAGDLRRILAQVAEEQGGAAADFGKVKDKEILEAVEALRRDLEGGRTGMVISEVAKGLRLENEAGCGPWVRQMLEKGKPARLSRPALETLAIIAYRQPVTRAQIEAVRGVAVDQLVRNLLEMQLIRVAGRSDLPGRPWLFGTTQKFLEHFGLNSLDDLPGVEELRTLADGAGGGAAPATGHTDDPDANATDGEEQDEGGEPAGEASAPAMPPPTEPRAAGDAGKVPEGDAPEPSGPARIDLAGRQADRKDAPAEEQP